MNKKLLINSLAAFSFTALLGACSFFANGKADAPTNSNLELKESRGVSSAQSSGSGLFGTGSNNKPIVGIGVNSYLWRATLDTLSFLPLVSADAFGGTIITDWYEDPKTRGERFKVNAYITDKVLRVDALKISVFKQRLDTHGTWRNIDVDRSVATDLEDTILTRAREMRLSETK